jgi:hypothetical protein
MPSSLLPLQQDHHPILDFWIDIRLDVVKYSYLGLLRITLSAIGQDRTGRNQIEWPK